MGDQPVDFRESSAKRRGHSCVLKDMFMGNEEAAKKNQTARTDGGNVQHEEGGGLVF